MASLPFGLPVGPPPPPPAGRVAVLGVALTPAITLGGDSTPAGALAAADGAILLAADGAYVVIG